MKKCLYSVIVILLTFQNIFAKEIIFETNSFKLSLDESGRITSLYDKINEKEYLLEEHPAPLISIRCKGIIEAPKKAVLSNGSINFSFDDVEAQVRVLKQPSYISFELVSLTSEEKVELVIWGPYPTRICEIIGEAVGVVRDSEFALGIQALNVKTLGGFPSEENDIEPAYDIFETGDLVDMSSEWRNKKFYRGQTAKGIEGGSALQAYTRNRNKERIITNWGHAEYVAPPFEDGGLIGSKIALFGCPPEKALPTIGEIELAEGLPHPTIDGEWAKTSTASTASYLIIGFNGNNLEKAITLTQKAGLEYLYHGGPFKTWGHFQLNENAFPDNWKSMKKYVEVAESHGIKLGVHTLTNFISTDDPYVTPVPDKRLAKVGESNLTSSLDENADEVPVDSPVFFNQMENNTLHSAVIGNEIIRYREVSKTAPWRLIGCIRGAYGTVPSSHEKGATIGKLMDHGYKVFLSNAELSIEIAKTLAHLFNETGLKQISFDGLEGVWATGMGQYARSLFTKTWFDHLNPELQGKVINDASNPSHYNWHINTRYNWGEPWYAGFRESQTNYRLMNQDFYRRNLLPSMLGWFNISDQTSIEDTEWLLARAAGFDAGFALNVSFENVEKNGQSEKIFNAINNWETARMAGAFSPEQKLRMEDIENEYHLEPAGEKKWNLFPFHVERLDHVQQLRQPGEPVSSSFGFDNPYEEQVPQMTLKLKPGDKGTLSTVSKIIIEFNNFDLLEVPIGLKNNQVLKLTADGLFQLFDQNWNLLETVNHTGKIPLLSEGENTLRVEALFGSEDGTKLNIEMKTRGNPESVKAP